jgi:hypothetical protein
MSDDRIPKDLKQAIKNRKGIKLKNKISEAIFGGKNKKSKKEKDKMSETIDVKMELIKTPEFKDRNRDAFKLATKLNKPVPGGIGQELRKQSMKNRFLKKPNKPINKDPEIMMRPNPFEAELEPRRKNMGGKIIKTKPVTMNMGGQADGVEDLTTEVEIID